MCPTKDPAGENKAGTMWANLEVYLSKLSNIKVMYSSPAVRLVQNPANREVLGVTITQNGVTKHVKGRKGTVVCGGGWEFNEEMTHNFQQMVHCYSYGSPYNTGETIKMSWEAGAAPRNMGVCAAPTYVCAGIVPGYKGVIGVANYTSKGAFIMVGRNNKRFKDEYRQAITGIQNKAVAAKEGTLTYSGQQIQNGAYVKQPWPEPTHYIFDEAARHSTKLFTSAGTFGWVACVEGFVGSNGQQRRARQRLDHQGRHHRELASPSGAIPSSSRPPSTSGTRTAPPPARTPSSPRTIRTTRRMRVRLLAWCPSRPARSTRLPCTSARSTRRAA